MQIAHEQAHKLIQLNADKALSSEEIAVLSAHLRDCVDCQRYASEIKEVEQVLFPLLKRKLNRPLIPLSISALSKRKQSPVSNLLTTRSAAVMLVMMAVFFSVWQFVSSGPATSSQVPSIVPPVPTPFAQTTFSTSTLMTLETCESMLYVVRAGDTLARIADQFSVSAEEIMAINLLKTEAVSPSMELVIPICKFTPTGTVHPATFTTTYTPILSLTTSTPDG
jgi:LysM repeat protein